MANKKYPKMDRLNRAKQFMPFDSLKGFREALAQKERVPVLKRELSEECKEEIDAKLQQIQKMDPVTVEYFHQGEYVQVTGAVAKVDRTNRIIKIADTDILFDDISGIESCS